MRRAPSTPDTSVKQHYLGHAWIEALYSRTQRYRAVITRDAGPVYRVYSERWDDSDWADWGTAAWVPGEKSFTDTIDRAREIAKEFLAATPDGLAADERDVGDLLNDQDKT